MRATSTYARVGLAALAAVAALPLAAAQNLSAACDPMLSRPIAYSADAGAFFMWDLTPVCQTEWSYNWTDAYNHTYRWNLGGQVIKLCLPEEYRVNAAHGSVTQQWRDDPPCGNPPECTDPQTGEPACCTGDCTLLAAYGSAPAYAFADPSDPAGGGLVIAQAPVPTK
jgi:hypothetical protein